MARYAFIWDKTRCKEAKYKLQRKSDMQIWPDIARCVKGAKKQKKNHNKKKKKKKIEIEI